MGTMHRAERSEHAWRLVGVRRLSRKTDTTHSPELQKEKIETAVARVGGEIIAWADDFEVSGATNPLEREGLGPWLRGEMGPYDGLAGSAVDRIGRNVRDVLNTVYSNDEAGRILVTADHSGIWDFTDGDQEEEMCRKATNAQSEHRRIRTRNQDETVRAREAGQKTGPNSYGYQYIRKHPRLPIERVEIDPYAADILRTVAQRILADETGTITPATEAARLNREGVLAPLDYRREKNGREAKGGHWHGGNLRKMLRSEAALGYLMHSDKPVLGRDGRPQRIAPELWSRATRGALIEATNKVPGGTRAPRGTYLLTGRFECGNCEYRLQTGGGTGKVNAKTGKTSPRSYLCRARQEGWIGAEHCKPSPAIQVDIADSHVETWFLKRYGSGQVMRRQYDPGTGYASQIKELKEDRKRLREDRIAGLYDSDDDAEWYRSEYQRMGQEIERLKKLPERPPSVRMVPTGQTIAEKWYAAKDNAERRELLVAYEVKVKLFGGSDISRVKIEGVQLRTQQAA